MSAEELFPLVDPDGNVVGSATRRECHSGSMLLHPVVHLHIFSPDGALLLQKRSDDKDIQPGRWDTSVGGHVDFGETVDEALRREVAEELGLTDFEPKHLKPYVFQSTVERELVNPFITVVPRDYPFKFQREEISEIRFWTPKEIEEAIGKGILTPNFEQEYSRLLKK
ncbi:MAG: NUDIX domain-containing protein [Muribaculaceae bacterium]|nr:NUDIX domain-containing protein [Muribaculaceae bacterium]